MELKVTIGFLSAVSLAVLVPSRAEALTYYLTGTDTYSCTAGANACTITYDNFGLEFIGGAWQSSPLSGQVLFSTTGDSRVFNTSSTVQSFTSGQDILISSGSSSFEIQLRSAPTTTPGEGINIDSLISTNFPSNTSLVLTSSTLTGDGLALAVPFVPSLFSLFPIISLAKRKKQRILCI